MANEIRVRSAVLAGTITDNPLLVGATSFNSARLADVPAIGATEHYPIVLDPLGVNGAPEVVWITAHTASQTSATITRAREGTTARQHQSGTTWYHGPSVNDYVRVVTSAPSGSGLPFDGQSWYHHTEKRLYFSEAGSAIRIAHTTAAGRTGGTWTRGANQPITTGSYQDITWPTESTDSDGFLAPTSATLTVPAGLGGPYMWELSFTWSGDPSTQALRIVKAGSNWHNFPLATSGTTVGASGNLLLNAGDTVKFQVIQTNAGTLQLNPATLNFYRIGI